MVVSLKASKKRLVAIVVLLVAVVSACVFLRGEQTTEPQVISGGTPEERVAYLQSFGWQVDSEPDEMREVMIPAEFNDVYTTYNVMQKAQGFDLLPYAGQVVTQYKYYIQNYPNETEVYATLLVQGDRIIGGDVASSQAGGFMHGFAKDSAAYGETAQIKENVSSAPEDAVSSESDETASSVSSAVEEIESTAAELYEEGAYPTD